jgi:hypothetical protein
LALAENLGFDKQFAERRVRRVRGRQCEHDFRVTRYIDRPASVRAVADVDSAELDVIIRRNGDLGLRLDIVITTAERRPTLRETASQVPARLSVG